MVFGVANHPSPSFVSGWTVDRRDAARLGRRLKSLRGANPEKIQRLSQQVAEGEALVATRVAALPAITYPDLPVSDIGTKSPTRYAHIRLS